MAGTCYEDAGLMSYQEVVEYRPTVRHEAHGNTACSIVGSGEASGRRSGVYIDGRKGRKNGKESNC